jgi:hypothetical protein
MIGQVKGRDFDLRQQYIDIKDFRNKKRTLETEYKRLLGFYEFNKSALISEFSVVKDFNTLLEENVDYLNKHMEEYNSKVSMNINEKIHNILYTDGLPTNFYKNYLPKTTTRIYQPIDRTNQITVYDAESENFKSINIIPDKLPGFAFLPFSRYINFNGKLIVCGGYGEKGHLSKSVWILENKKSFELNMEKKSRRKQSCDLYDHINRSSVYEDNFNGYVLIKASDMIYPRAGHAMVCYSSNVIYAISGTEGNETCEVYSMDTNKWEEVASLNQHRIDPTACIYKNYLYVFFGLLYNKNSRRYSFLDSIERISTLNIQKKEWEMVIPKTEDLLKNMLPRSLCGVLIKHDGDGLIYLCGGQTDKEVYSAEIFEYNMETNKLTLSEKTLPKPSAFLEQNFLYVFKTGINFDIYGDMFYYNSSSDSFNFYYQKLNEK